MKRYKVVVSFILSIVLVASLLSFSLFSQTEAAAYHMYINNKFVGVVKYAAKGLAYYDSAMAQLRSQYPESVTIQADVYFKEISGDSSIPATEEQISNAIRQSIEVRIPAYAIQVEGNIICYLESKQEAEQLIDFITKPYADSIQSSNGLLQKVGFSEDLQFVPVTIPYDRLVDWEDALALLQKSVEGVVTHSALDGETFWSLAIANNMEVEEIMALNPDLDPGKIKEGDTIVLSAEKKLLTFVSEEIFTIAEDIPYITEKQDDNTLLKGETERIQEGKKGKKEVQVLVTRENGRETSRKVIEETILIEPINEVIAVGTKKPAPTPMPDRSKPRATPTPKPTAAPTPKPTAAPAPSSKPTNSPAPTTEPAETPKPTQLPSKNGVTGQDIVDYAKTLLGKPYVYGAAGPDAFDCSGFTVYVYKHFGIHIQRMKQIEIGTGVKKADMLPGDIICFTGHVGIYIGDGNMIHASSTRGKIEIRSIYSGRYVKDYLGSRRIIN